MQGDSTLKKYKNGVIHIKLYHATPKENIESINSNGLDNRRRSIAKGYQVTTKLTTFIDSHVPEEMKEKVDVKVIDAIYLFVSDSFEQAKKDYPDYAIYEVDYTKLDPFYLMVFNHIVSRYIAEDMGQLIGVRSRDEAIEWAKFYWLSRIEFTLFVEQAAHLKKHYLELTGVEYIPEVLYFGNNIPPEYLTLITE